MNPLKKKPKTKNFSEIPAKPEWLKVKIPFSTPENPSKFVRKTLDANRLHTVCESASCPNLNSCWSRKTATYMISGDICTRRCGYCDVATGRPLPLDQDEPKRVAESVKLLDLDFVVITAVNRDDLEDGGASQFALCIQEIRKIKPNCKIEVLIPDFKGKESSLEIIFSSKPNIINHNLETVRSLFPAVAPQKNYELSLEILKAISKRGFLSKSGLILGMGESLEEVKQAIYEMQQILWQLMADVASLGEKGSRVSDSHVCELE
ncbi:MAG: lipoyl synthase, partial [Leptospiraceae bacterium]|nr:lipoyl synthase [Leptospiraceae bacterium]